METIAWSEVQYKPAATLPRLSTTRNGEGTRRDSITSSRSRDSGYISDPEVSLSPLEFLSPDTGAVSLPFAHELRTVFECPDVVNSDINLSSFQARKAQGPARALLLRKTEDAKDTRPATRGEITSNPTSSRGADIAQKHHWTNAFKNPPKVFAEGFLTAPIGPDSTTPTGQNNDFLGTDESFQSDDRPKERVSSIVSFESTGSGGDYSATDDSEDEMADMASETMSKATLTTIELIMRKIEVNLRYAAYVQCAGGQTSRRQSAANSSRRGSAQGNVGGNSKRKSRGEENLHPDDQDEDGPTKKRRVSITTTEGSENGPKFACPFYKHEPNQYRTKRTCTGPGWPTVHRMKEHLYRSHAQPIFCPRCYNVFESDGDLSTHLRSNPCQMSAPRPMDGIDRETLHNLRKRSTALRLEEEKWRDVYQLLFPDVAEPDIPSPYYDCDSPTEESRRFRRELLSRIRNELFVTAEQEHGQTEQNLLRQVANIIRRCEDDLLNSFHAGAGPTVPPPLPPLLSPRSPMPGVNATDSEMHNATPAPLPTPAPPAEPFAGNTQAPYLQTPLPYPTIPTWEDPFQFSSNGIVDWDIEFPPGGIDLSYRGESNPRLSNPVWT